MTVPVLPLWIGGREVHSGSGRTGDVFDPSTGEVIRRAPFANAAEVGQAVGATLTHPDVNAVSFVGSTPIARHVYETAARTGKRVQALGGARNHAVSSRWPAIEEKSRLTLAMPTSG